MSIITIQKTSSRSPSFIAWKRCEACQSRCTSRPHISSRIRCQRQDHANDITPGCKRKDPYRAGVAVSAHLTEQSWLSFTWEDDEELSKIYHIFKIATDLWLLARIFCQKDGSKSWKRHPTKMTKARFALCEETAKEPFCFGKSCCQGPQCLQCRSAHTTIVVLQLWLKYLLADTFDLWVDLSWCEVLWNWLLEQDKTANAPSNCMHWIYGVSSPERELGWLGSTRTRPQGSAVIAAARTDALDSGRSAASKRSFSMAEAEFHVS